jgi:hypothetical protein
LHHETSGQSLWSLQEPEYKTQSEGKRHEALEEFSPIKVDCSKNAAIFPVTVFHLFKQLKPGKLAVESEKTKNK